MADVSVGTLLGAAGACPEIVFNGKVWRIGHPTQKAKSCLETLALAKGSEGIAALKNAIDATAYKEYFESHKADVQNGQYMTWGEKWHEIVFSGKNTHLFLLSLMRTLHPEASETDAILLAVNKPEEVQLALVQVVPDFLGFLLDDPKVPVEQKPAVRDQIMAIFQKTPPSPLPTAPGELSQ
jgi:hypothetical protein